MTDSPQRPDRISSADVLPPVEPPNAGFIVQLFIIPAVIVTIIITVWALFSWLAHMESDPRSYAEALRRNNVNRWQEAVNLANELQKQGNEELKKDGVLAGDLAKLLGEEIDAADYDDKAVTLRVYLCRVLGEFLVPDVVPVLLKAAKTERDERERDVRLSALQGLARLISSLGVETQRTNSALEETLLTAAKDTSPVIRYHAAYTLGVLGGTAATAQLEALLKDANADVRMNAAIGLARNGSTAGEAMLQTMLAGTDPDLTADEKSAELRPTKMLSIQFNALEAIEHLAKSSTTADLSSLAAAVERLIASNPQANLRAKAEATKQALATRGRPGS